MKGVVFTEFLAFVAEIWDEDMVDDIIEAAALPSQGAYTSVGTYDHREIVSLLFQLSERGQCPVDDLMERFGFYLAGRFSEVFPSFFSRCSNLYTFLASIDDYIHVEVQKLYPDAELPSFDVLQNDGVTMVLRYRSTRKMDALAEGLMHGAASHFGKNIRVEKNGSDDGSVIFVITEVPS